MEALRIIKDITDDRIEELNQYKGQRVEIIILPEISEESHDRQSILDLKGASPDLIDGMEFQKKLRSEWES